MHKNKNKTNLYVFQMTKEYKMFFMHNNFRKEAARQMDNLSSTFESTMENLWLNPSFQKIFLLFIIHFSPSNTVMVLDSTENGTNVE